MILYSYIYIYINSNVSVLYINTELINSLKHPCVCIYIEPSQDFQRVDSIRQLNIPSGFGFSLSMSFVLLTSLSAYL